MCNLAGFIGNENAAPVLIEMLRKQEGFGGGYQTGIATIDENGKIHTRRVIGSTHELCAQTDAEQLPGKVGIIHARSKESGGDAWGHPQVSADGSLALVANGHVGYWEDLKHMEQIFDELIAEGYELKTISDKPDLVQKHTPRHYKGKYAFFTEGLALRAHYWSNKTGSALQGLAHAVEDLPGEVAILALDENAPGKIMAARFNQPMMIGKYENNIYLSTTALAFPEFVKCSFHAPICSVMEFGEDGYKVQPFPEKISQVAAAFPWDDGFEAIKQVLENAADGVGVQDGKNATSGLWSADLAPQKDMMVYEIFRRLYIKGEIEFVNRPQPGLLPGIQAPHFRAVLKKQK
jgi:glucosamine--fructose-6-phosphate aminotransferase (isomerizing)